MAPKPINQRSRKELTERLGPWLEVFQIAPDDRDKWLKLSAHWLEVLQGLEQPKKPGAKKKWDFYLEFWLAIRVRREMMDRNVNISDACQVLAGQPPWNNVAKSRSSERSGADILRERYHRFMARPVDFKLLDTGEVKVIDYPAPPTKKRRGSKYGR